MKTFAAVAAFVASASAFQAPTATRGASSLRAGIIDGPEDLKQLQSELCPAIPFWDPLNFSGVNLWDMGVESSNGWLRQAEIKHGRVAMFGFVGYLVHANGIKWPWPMTMDGAAFPTADTPGAVWDAIPVEAKWQIILFVGFLEFWSENSANLASDGQAHYMKGGKPGYFPSFDNMVHPVPLNLYDPLGLNSKKTEEQKAKGLRAELNNGRLAMIGLMGFLAESKVQGSVPFLKTMGVVQPYDGSYMVPFEGNFHLPGI